MVIILLPVGAYTYALHLNEHNATLPFPNLLVILYTCFLPHTTLCINESSNDQSHSSFIVTCPGTLNITINLLAQQVLASSPITAYCNLLLDQKTRIMRARGKCGFSVGVVVTQNPDKKWSYRKQCWIVT